MARGKYQEWLKEENLILLEGWARDGLTDEQISINIGINVSTLYDWKKKYPKISESLKKGKEVIDFQVENALLKKALGYIYEEETAIKIKDASGNEKIEARKVKKYAHPDTMAQIYWLNNRKPQQWRNRKDYEANLKDKIESIIIVDEWSSGDE
ncbi:helix-turn-helix domain-containing protein [Helcococcus kunzii]|uniref:helix-turn-helix domain-containing protein n=1 Tax=Helcococcus kunzii TaxID=40091 RepID=UPI0038A5DFBF